MRFNDLTQIRFLGRHRCPRCRMPLYAEELACPVCELAIVFLNPAGEVMVEMIDVRDPHDLTDADVQEYRRMMQVESTGDMYLTTRYLPTRPRRADLEPLPDGGFGVRFANRVTLADVTRPQ